MSPAIAFPPPVNPDDPGNGPLIMGLLWTFTALATVAVGMRFYVRNKMRGFKFDDWIMLVALVRDSSRACFQACHKLTSHPWCQLFQIAGSCLLTIAFHYGLGKHDASIQKPDQMVNFLKWNWIGVGPGQVTSILARISITISLVQLFGIHTWFKWFLIIVTSVQSIMGVAILVMGYLQVDPIEGLWNVFLVTARRRFDSKIYSYMGYAGQCELELREVKFGDDLLTILIALYTFTDFAYVLLPIIIIWDLHMTLQRRIGLCLLMTLSLFTMAMSIMKTTCIRWQGAQDDPNVMYKSSLQVMWAGMEQTCVVIMGCVPAIRPIVKVDLPKLSQITASLSSFMGTNRSKTQSSTVAKSKTRNSYTESGIGGTYYNIELAQHKGGATTTTTITHSGYPQNHGSDDNLFDSRYIRQTQQFAVTYQNGRQTREGFKEDF